MDPRPRTATSPDFSEEIIRWISYNGETPPLATKDYPKSSNPTNKPLKIHFGELRFVAIASIQTSLLLLRSTVWRLYLVFGFHRAEQLPYFTSVPSSSAESILLELVESINPDKEKFKDFVPGSKDKLKQAIVDTLKADVVSELLKELYKVFEVAHDHWKGIIALAAQELQNKGNKQLQNELSPDEKKLLKELQKASSSNKDAHEAEDISPESKVNQFTAWCSLEPDCLILDWSEELGNDFLKALMSIAKLYSMSPEPYAPLDRLAFHMGYYLLSQGQNPFEPYKCRTLGTPGFRKINYQTYLSLTDPGPGHIFGTTGKAEWMNGSIVHVEHLERPAGTTKAQVESYRIPSVLEFARIRLHTGDAAPNTCYIGRPLHDNGDLKYDFIKVIDTVSSACTSMFQLGTAECKIAMGGLKASDMVAYMRALRGHTLKNYRQCLSAAFNLHTPLVDDIEKRYLDKPMEIALRAIDLTALGGFDKVTWDGASDSYPSVPLLQLPNDGDPRSPDTPNPPNGLLSLLEAKQLVHQAHSAGLLTYFSAGFKQKHIAVAVQSGVDGIGIGGAQVLRNMDSQTGMHGDYMEWRISELIKLRDAAATDIFGQAARLLARLDQMYYEGSLNEGELDLRKHLYESLHQENPFRDTITQELEGEIGDNVNLITEDQDTPWIARAKRLVQRRGLDEKGKPNPSLLELCNKNEWPAFETTLSNLLKPLEFNAEESRDPKVQEIIVSSVEGDVHSFSMSPRWKKLTEAYRELLRARDRKQKPKVPWLERIKHFKGDVDLNIKATPFENKNSPAIIDLFKSKDDKA